MSGLSVLAEAPGWPARWFSRSFPPRHSQPPSLRQLTRRLPCATLLQILPIDDRPTWLMAMVGVFCCVGPLTLAGFFTYEKVYKKD